MNEAIGFTENFLKRHPRKAASVLEGLPVEDTARFLGEIPVELAIIILEILAPQYAAQCFLIMPTETCSELMQGMKAVSGISLLRFMPKSMTQAILKRLLPDKKALLKRRLAYPQDLVGAWMDSENPAVSEFTLVGDIRKSIRRSKNEIGYSPCVINPDGTVMGLVGLAKLIAARDSIPVSNILEREFKAISDRATVKSVSSLPHWDKFEALPVVDRQDRFIGILTLKSLKRALAVMSGEFSSDRMNSVLMDGVNAYISTLEWLASSLAAPLSVFSADAREFSHDR